MKKKDFKIEKYGYVFKANFSGYCRWNFIYDLEWFVDELNEVVIANGGFRDNLMGLEDEVKPLFYFEVVNYEPDCEVFFEASLKVYFDVDSCSFVILEEYFLDLEMREETFFNYGIQSRGGSWEM